MQTENLLKRCRIVALAPKWRKPAPKRQKIQLIKVAKVPKDAEICRAKVCIYLTIGSGACDSDGHGCRRHGGGSSRGTSRGY